MTKKVLVHVRCNKAGKVRKEVRNGRDVIIVPSATMPDNIVMNDIMYPAEAIKNSFETLNRTPAPLGHPQINGEFISARDPEGINLGWIGAWNENVRQEGGKVLLDKVIDVKRASQSEEGRRVLDAVEKSQPIHTSTGILANLLAANGEVDYKFTADDMVFDHDAILLDEDGAATPNQGVGMMVNSQGERKQIDLINSAIDSAEQDMDWAAEAALRAIEKAEKAPLVDRIKSAIREAIMPAERGTTTANEDNQMNDEQYTELSAKIAESNENIEKAVGEAITNALKPLTDKVDSIEANAKAKEDAELNGLREKIVNANLMDEDCAKELTINAARALVKQSEPGSAAVVNGAFRRPDSQSAFKLPAAQEAS